MMNNNNIRLILLCISMITISLFGCGCYSYGGLNVRRPEGSHKILEAEAAPRVNEDRCYADIFNMHVVFNRVKGDDIYYEGVEIKCDNHAVPFIDIEGYSIMRDNILRVNADNCNDVYNAYHRGDKLASIPTSQLYYELQVLFKNMETICTTSKATTLSSSSSSNILPPIDGSLCNIQLPYMNDKGYVTLKYSQYNNGYMFHNGYCLDKPIDGDKFIMYSRISKKGRNNNADIPFIYMGMVMSCNVITNVINAPIILGYNNDNTLPTLNSREMAGLCNKLTTI